ncbi:MAG: hypothetical protein QOF00_5710 [Pseudonocardiales bacterium]|nr:hypothetical protein [Pseudonocardiales bacterium]
MTVVPTTLRATIDLPPDPRSVPAARSVVAQLLAAWAAGSFCDNALLLLSELVTNVLRHVVSDAALQVQVHLADPVLRVSVADDSADPPRTLEPGAAGGHGMWLLAVLADRWGSEQHGSGKQVWFELTRDAGDEPPVA